MVPSRYEYRWRYCHPTAQEGVSPVQSVDGLQELARRLQGVGSLCQTVPFHCLTPDRHPIGAEVAYHLTTSRLNCAGDSLP